MNGFGAIVELPPTPLCKFLPLHIDALRSFSNTQENDSSNFNTQIISERALDAQQTVVICEGEVGTRARCERYSVVDVKRAFGCAITSDSNEDLKVSCSELFSGHSAVSSQRQDGSTTDVNWDLGKSDVIQGDRFALSLDNGVILKVVEYVVGEVDVDGCGIFFGYRGNEDGITEEELEVDTEGVGVLGVFVPEGVQHGCSVEASLVESGEDVIDQTISRVTLGQFKIFSSNAYLISRTFLAASVTDSHR